jgi:hypothetical protein
VTTEATQESVVQATVGRIVHFWGRDIQGEPLSPRAAIVTGVHEGNKLSMAVFSGNGHFQSGWQYVPYSKEPRLEHWSWPEKK